MLRLDDFTAHVATSGLVAPEVMARVQAELDPEPAADASRAAGSPADPGQAG